MRFLWNKFIIELSSQVQILEDTISLGNFGTILIAFVVI